jgi:hypothetical protein
VGGWKSEGDTFVPPSVSIPDLAAMFGPSELGNGHPKDVMFIAVDAFPGSCAIRVSKADCCIDLREWNQRRQSGRQRHLSNMHWAVMSGLKAIWVELIQKSALTRFESLNQRGWWEGGIRLCESFADGCGR